MDTSEMLLKLNRLTDILYKIYVQTLQERNIAEQNYHITEHLLLKSNNRNDQYICNFFDKPKKVQCTCKQMIDSPQKNKVDELEEKYVENIENVLEKANLVRTNMKAQPYLKQDKLTKNKMGKKVQSTPSVNISKIGPKTKLIHKPSIASSTISSGQSFILQTHLEELQGMLRSNEEPVNGLLKLSKPLQQSSSVASKAKSIPNISSNQLQFQHSVMCPLSKSTSRISNRGSRSSVGYPVSLESIRLSPEIQRILKLYYKFVANKSKSIEPRKSKAKTAYLERLNSMNSQLWDQHQKEDYKQYFELYVYINTYSKLNPPERMNDSRLLLCKFYSSAETLHKHDEIVNEKKKIDRFKEILLCINNELIDFIQSSSCQSSILPSIYKCITNIIHIYKFNRSDNVVVIKV